MRLPSTSELITLVRERIPTKPPKLARAQWIWIGAGVSLALLLVWLAWPRAQTVEIAVIDRGPVRSEVIDEGRTRIHDVFVVSAPVSGELQRVELEPGDAVEQGQIVATILPADPALLDARVAAEANAGVIAAQAALDAAQAEYRLAQSDRQRVATLQARDFASQAALDAADAALSATRASVNARRADLVRARAAAGANSARARRATPVASPAAGRVLRLLQESETIALAGSPLMEIGDPDQVEIVAEFLSQDAVRMQAGAAAYIENWGGDTPIAARVFRIEPYARTKISALGVEEQRVNVILHLQAPEEGPPLGHGFRVDARVVVAEQNDALRVPTDALVRDGRDWAVFVLESGRAHLTPVTIGAGGEDYRAVTQGLELGQRVVLFPGDSLADGARIRSAR
ncbi:MAG: efflux RND transporter periplasmic adaptor subunit [Caulobacterales bacterium]|jgi:HlyD family secretion protein|nr:efflux RND transporter periplasmic adaptor subunit [Caulobacterales bacterium]